MRYLFPLIHLLVALWVFYDSQKRGYSVWRGLLWAIGVFFILIIFLPLYLIARKKRERLLAQAGRVQPPSSMIPCFYCGKGYEDDPKICPHCGQNLKFEY